jgi:hypothetical protein
LLDFFICPENIQGSLNYTTVDADDRVTDKTITNHHVNLTGWQIVSFCITNEIQTAFLK